MSEDNNNNNPFNEKTIVQSSRPSSKDDVPPSIGADKTMVFAKSNLQDTFDAKTVVRSSKPAAPATLPDEAPARVIAAELPPTPAPQDADTNPDVRISSAVVNADKPKLSREERREARAALDRKTKKYVMAFGAVVALAVVIVVATVAGSGSEKTAGDSAKVVASESPAAAGQKSDLASEAAPEKVKNANMLGAYKTTTDVLKDFDRASQKAQDHSVGF